MSRRSITDPPVDTTTSVLEVTPKALVVALLVALGPVILGFVITQAREYFLYRRRRRSVAVAIYADIMHAKHGAKNFSAEYWTRFLNRIRNKNYVPMILITMDSNIMERVEFENMNYSPAVVSSIIQFMNINRVFYECVCYVNTDKFMNVTDERKEEIVNIVYSARIRLDKIANKAIEVMNKELPSKWFESIPPEGGVDIMSLVEDSAS